MGESRNVMLTRGISKYSRTAMYKKRGLFKKAGKPTTKVARASPTATKSKKIGGAKNGGTRDIRVQKPQKYYPTVDVISKSKRTKVTKTKAIRASITPGTVLILVSGKFAGKRVIALKNLPSGLIAVSGPFGLNGVPLKRVNQAYVIATSTKVAGVEGIAGDDVNDDFFKRPQGSKNKPSGDFFEKQDDAAKVLDPARIAAQKAVDAKLTPLIEKVPHLRDYMRSIFTLRKGQFPHEMQF
eukprot:m.27184 g.27184  ORF g.27184 m.27184 type:complete len:240 (+) comp15700_c0_seq1:131-850(+)